MIEIENNTKTGGIIFKLSHDKWMKYGSKSLHKHENMKRSLYLFLHTINSASGKI